MRINTEAAAPAGGGACWCRPLWTGFGTGGGRSPEEEGGCRAAASLNQSDLSYEPSYFSDTLLGLFFGELFGTLFRTLSQSIWPPASPTSPPHTCSPFKSIPIINRISPIIPLDCTFQFPCIASSKKSKSETNKTI